MPPNEVAEAERLHDCAAQKDKCLFDRGVAHKMPHLDIRYDSTAERLASESAVL